jgi:hydrogenase nickel incorporation protein HypA/HybF
MHELSLAMEVIKIAERESEKIPEAVIREISIEVGDLSGVEADAFQSALELLSKDSVLDKAALLIKKTAGTGFCNSCGKEFEMHSMIAACPQCNSFPSVVNGGREFRVISILVD